LGDLIFDKANELQIEKLQLVWKVDPNKFPTSYPTPNLDTGKASKILLQNGDTHIRGATHIASPTFAK